MALPEVTDINGLYQKVEAKFEDVSEFIACLDVLYALDRLELNRKTGELMDVN